jgi:hypothetical protein
MNRAVLRRAGGLFLFLAWVPVATANALPCAAFCLLEANLAQHYGMGDQDSHMAHHMQGAKISASGHCGTPQLLVVAFVPAELPAPPSINVAVADVQVSTVIPMVSATPEFATPPPRV